LFTISATCGGHLGEKIGDLGGITAWAGCKIVHFWGRTYKARFPAVIALQQLQSNYRRLIRPHLDSDTSNEFSFSGVL
jgi:hypothetical protein